MTETVERGGKGVEITHVRENTVAGQAFLFFIIIIIFFWLRWVLVAACGIFHCSEGSSLRCVGFSLVVASGLQGAWAL